MKNYTYRNTLISKKQLKDILSWSFTRYGSIKACFLADELKILGFKYATQAGISISIEDLRVPCIKNTMLQTANQEISNTEKFYLKGKITNVERFQKIIDTWNITSEMLKDEVVLFFKQYDPLNSVYIMAFSGARGNLSQVRQLVGMRGLMSDSSGEIMNLPIEKNFREGLTITDYLMSGYGARKGIVDTALKTANSGYLTRRLIDVAQDIIIREKDCLTPHSFILININGNTKIIDSVYEQVLGRLINKPIYDPKTNRLIAEINTQITPKLIRTFKQREIQKFYIRSPLTCSLYRAICQKCYGWDLSSENLIDMGEAIGIIAGQSIGEPGTQLTMRTFHTGGIFTSEANQQLISPKNGTIVFSNVLKTSKLRTNRGENVLVTKSSGFLSIVSEEDKDEIIQLELPRNTILFINDKQYVKQNTILAQLAGTIKQVRTEIKSIFSDSSGEIFMPRLKRKVNSTTQNKLLWILSGQLYKAPLNSFLNFHSDYKINKNSYIFRSKILNKHSGFIKLIENDRKLFEQIIEIKSNLYSLQNTEIKQLSFVIDKNNYLLTTKNSSYFINLESKASKYFIPNSHKKDFATLVTNRYQSMTGGTVYYNQFLNKAKMTHPNDCIYYIGEIDKSYSKTLIWLPEEIHQLNCDSSLLLIEPNIFISDNFELIPNIYSQISGIVQIFEKNNIIQEICIKPGMVYTTDNIEDLENKVFYPGEMILNTIEITQPSLCEIINVELDLQLLIRPIDLYESPIPKTISCMFHNELNSNSIFDSNNYIDCSYPSGRKIKKNKATSLITNTFNLKLKNFFEKNDNFHLEIIRDAKKNNSSIVLSERLQFVNYLSPYLKYTNIQSCLLVESKQFVNSHTILGYLETVNSQPLELVKLKSKRQQNKQIFLISNKDCITMEKSKLKNKTINDFIIDDININQIGKVIIDNGKNLTVQKGRPYFFPKCRNEDFASDSSLKYKYIRGKNIFNKSSILNKNSININYSNIQSRLVYHIQFLNTCTRLQFPRILLKKRGKYYTSSLPIFVREFLIRKEKDSRTKLSRLDCRPWYGYLDYKDKIHQTKRRDILPYTERVRLNNVFMLFFKNSVLVKKPFKAKKETQLELASVALLEYPFRTIAIHSITENYLEQEVNNVFCKDGEFLENGQTIGTLKFEKEITGDIVQGLPRIEELLEARRKKRVSKHTPKNQKKSILIRKTIIDPTFEFRKLGTTIVEGEKINPHSLLKVYFNYYARIKSLVCQGDRKLSLYRLANNYEASYRSFKKIQALVLKSVQSVYKSQGVDINDKHLEIIIKQMTTKVLITHEGQTPLLPREVIDLYHIKYINEIIRKQNKQIGYYVPLLLGITKAALNNPSFLSAASFQETTRVLTKAAIEGRLDWLRGLKENIIIGHLIPAGVGSKNYTRSFNRYSALKNQNKSGFLKVL